LEYLFSEMKSVILVQISYSDSVQLFHFQFSILHFTFYILHLIAACQAKLLVQFITGGAPRSIAAALFAFGNLLVPASPRLIFCFSSNPLLTRKPRRRYFQILRGAYFTGLTHESVS